MRCAAKCLLSVGSLSGFRLVQLFSFMALWLCRWNGLIRKTEGQRWVSPGEKAVVRLQGGLCHIHRGKGHRPMGPNLLYSYGQPCQVSFPDPSTR